VRRTVAALAGVLMAAWGPVPVPATTYGNPQYLVEPDWLAQRLGDGDLRIVDMRNEPQAYAGGHVPGAVYLGVNQIRLSLEESGFTMPPDYGIEELLGRLGIDSETTVVVYDDFGGLNAARLFFTLDYAGHEKMALLNGGLTRWVAEGRPLSREVSPVRETRYRVRTRTERVVTARWIMANLEKPNLALVDARSPREFSGEDFRAKRGGHIPGAVNIEWTRNLAAGKRFKSADELLALYRSAGVTPEKTVVAYCQTMHRGAMSYFALRLLGYPDVRGYDRSWSEWGNDLALPVSP
jgi:thiosulfate/3-mercaptopyruvate sulfurtransferase